MSDERRADSSRSQLRYELRVLLNQIIVDARTILEQAEGEGHSIVFSDLQKIETSVQRLGSLVEVLLSSFPDRSTAEEACAASEVVSERGGAAPRQVGFHTTGAAPGAASLPAIAAARLLVVDDDAISRELLMGRLQQEGYAVTPACGGADALALLERERFDLVLLDVMMPDVSGLNVLRTVRANASVTDLPIIMATANEQRHDVAEALRLGANDYVTKSLDFGVVLARVETQLSLKRASDEVKRLNAELHAAQERIDWLMESSTRALIDVNTWFAAVCAELTEALSADKVTIWNVADEVTDDAETWPEIPSIDSLQSAANARKFLIRGNTSIVPASGMSGDVFGALLVERSREWSDGDIRLVASFAHQVGGALELEQTRRELAEAEHKTRVSKRALMDRGIEIVQICPACGRCYGPLTQNCPEDTSFLESPRLIPHVIVERYELLSLIGQGGMSMVFAAHDQRLDRNVAVKILGAEHFDDPSVRMRFEQEARAAARIDHSGVVTIYDSGELPDGSGFIIMERLFGCDLGQLLREYGPGTPRQVASLVRQAAAALGAAHKAGLVHRDIKPENIFLEERAGGFSVKLLDFGIAKPIDLDTHLTHGGTLLGTPAYMAPEQLSGRLLDRRCDIYSFAAVAYEALLGRGVTLEKTLGKVIVDVLQSSPPLVSAMLQGTPALIDDAFCQALTKEPDLRPRQVEPWVNSFVDVLETMPEQVIGWPERLSAVVGTSLSAPTQAGGIVATIIAGKQEGRSRRHSENRLVLRQS